MYFEVKLTLILLLFVFCRLESVNAEPLDSLPPLAKMNFMELCEHFELNCEEHEVITEDGYKLTIFHIIGDKTNPVLLWHGLLDSSDTYLLRGHNSSGAVLAAAGYDLWLGNSRGNQYSRRHIKLDPDVDKKEFWDFSLHEMGYYDMAATIDYVLANTGQTQLSAIGHSQGTSMFYVLASTRPIYNSKINIFISLAPIAYLNHIRGLAVEILAVYEDISDLLPLFRSYELLKADNHFIQDFCSKKILGNVICRRGLFMGFSGSDDEEFEAEFMKVLIGHHPAGASKKSIDHFVQIYNRRKFAQFDYGFSKNLQKYNTVNPPDYNLSAITAPVALLVGANDKLSTIEDAEQLYYELPNVVYYKVMDRPEFNHLDFVIAKNVDTYINPELLYLLCQYREY